MLSDGNFSWRVKGADGIVEKGRSIGHRRPQPRAEYKNSVRDCSKRGVTCVIRIFKATSPRARNSATHIYNEQTRKYGFKPHWHRVNDQEMIGWTEKMSEIDTRDQLAGMSYQDKQERWVQSELARYGIVPAFRYRHNRPVKHERHITISRPKSTLFRRERK